MLPPLVFLRHGQTSWNAEGRLQGQRDIPLNDIGRGQAKRNGEAIIAAMPHVADYDFVASPLVRARETMEIARLAMGLDPTTYHLDDRLKELSFGDWEGFTGAELGTQDKALLATREDDKWAFVPPGGESYAVLLVRVREWLDTLTRPTFVVAHGGVGRVIRADILGVDPLTAVSDDFPQDRLLVIESGEGRWL